MDWIIYELVVDRGQDKLMMDCLTNQHAIERIAMNWRKLQDLSCRSGLEWKTDYAVLPLLVLQILIGRRW